MMKHIKNYKLFEAYPPNDFIITSERLFSELLPDVKDILLELIDTGIKVDINKYIDDVIFEFQIEIEFLETSEQKQICEDSLFRLEDYLSEYNLHLAKIEMVQFESGSRHDFEMYDMSELADLKSSTGEINILIYFAKNNN